MTPSTIKASHSGTWTLGDLTVNRLGFGTMRLTGSGAFSEGTPSDRDRAIGVLRRAVELGVNHLDTATFYFSSTRSATELINTALAPYPDDLVIATKVGPSRDASGEWMPFPRPEELRGQVEENIRQLGRDHLDVVNLRVFSTKTAIADHFGALAELREAGLIRHLGLSTVGPEQVKEAQAIAPVVCVQNAYGLGYRPQADAFIEDLGRQGIAFVPFFAIAGASREAGRTGGDPDEVKAIAEAHGISPAELRIAWSLHKGPNVLAIPGTGDPKHLESNVAAGGVRLTEDELAVLEKLHQAGERD